MTRHGLLRGFIESAERFSERPALSVDGQVFSYEALRACAAQISAAISTFQPEDYPLGAVLAARSVTAYAGILGILASGKGYVPLNPKFPVVRSRKMLSQSGSKILIVDAGARPLLPELLADFDSSLTVILPDCDDVADLAEALPQHRFVSSHELPDANADSFSANADPDAIAYLLFTSGSTGEPKGVPISHANIRAYLAATCNRYEVSERDRVSQLSDLTFDPSVHDMFVAWERGACLCCVPERSVMAPTKFIRDAQLTLWFSVPSVARFLSRMHLLAPGSFPTLRCSVFCGESLAATLAQQWQEAAPNSIVENLYGPTEATIAITRYRWDARTSPSESENGIVPIGMPLDGQRVSVVSEDLRPVVAGEVGELCLAGDQVARGYWNDSQKTARQFVRLPEGGNAMWYRTGDRVKQRPDGCLLYVGRVDQQAKIRGYRVELQEIERAIRDASGADQVAAVPWPISQGNADGVIAFIAGADPYDTGRILERCRVVLPSYMVPSEIHRLDSMPLNPNGKTDRAKLAEYLEVGQPC